MKLLKLIGVGAIILPIERVIMNKANNTKTVRSSRGFTLVELMIVVVIIGILAALAIPRFMRATTKSKQSEAKSILKQIFTMQLGYRHEHDIYFVDPTPANAANPTAYINLGLGVEIMLSARYTYTISSTDAGATNFLARAESGILDDDASPDVWQINELGILSVVTDDAL